jgi:hypothetical protein
VPVGESASYHRNDPRYLEDIIRIKTEVKEHKNKATGQREIYEKEVGPYRENWDQVLYTLIKISESVSNGSIAFLKKNIRSYQFSYFFFLF